MNSGPSEEMFTHFNDDHLLKKQQKNQQKSITNFSDQFKKCPDEITLS
jgi:hypothetical protein